MAALGKLHCSDALQGEGRLWAGSGQVWRLARIPTEGGARLGWRFAQEIVTWTEFSEVLYC